jgi:hypothetical protein
MIKMIEMSKGEKVGKKRFRRKGDRMSQFTILVSELANDVGSWQGLRIDGISENERGGSRRRRRRGRERERECVCVCVSKSIRIIRKREVEARSAKQK